MSPPLPNGECCGPYPSKKRIADRLGLSPRQFQRYIAELEKAGFVNREERRGSHGGKLTNYYDLNGLVERLKTLAPEFRKEMDAAKARREAVERPGYRLDAE